MGEGLLAETTVDRSAYDAVTTRSRYFCSLETVSDRQRRCQGFWRERFADVEQVQGIAADGL